MRGLDMMKKWPWMRDLPTCIWAGHGWAYDANSGLRRLSSAGGGDAMQGVEVWESIGTGPEEVQSKVEVAMGAVERRLVEPGAMPQLAQTPSKIMRHNVAKQSGVPGVSWNGSMWAWEVRCPKLDPRGKVVGKTGRAFSIRSFMKQGLTEDEADAAALEAAKAFRADLVRQGLVKEPKANDPQFTSDVVGVRWDKEKKKWRVQFFSGPKEGQERSRDDRGRPLRGEGGGRGQGAGARRGARPAALRDGRGALRGAPRGKAQGAVPGGEVGVGRAAVARSRMRCGCPTQFPSEAQGLLGGRAREVFPGGRSRRRRN